MAQDPEPNQAAPAVDELDRRMRRTWAYLRRHDVRVLIVSIFLVSYFLAEASDAASWLWDDDLGGNVAAEILGVLLGALLTVLVVEGILRRRREQEWEQVRDVAARRFAWILFECLSSLHGALGRGGFFQFGGGGFDDTRYVVGLLLEARRELFEDSNQFFRTARGRIKDHDLTYVWLGLHDNVDVLMGRIDASLNRFGGRLPPGLESSLLAVEKALADTDRMLVEFKLHRVPEDPTIGYAHGREEQAEDFLALACTQLWEAVRTATGPVVAALDAEPDVSGSRILEPPEFRRS